MKQREMAITLVVYSEVLDLLLTDCSAFLYSLLYPQNVERMLSNDPKSSDPMLSIDRSSLNFEFSPVAAVGESVL